MAVLGPRVLGRPVQLPTENLEPCSPLDRSEVGASLGQQPAVVVRRAYDPHHCCIAATRAGLMIGGTTRDDCATRVGLAELAVPRLPPVA